MKTIIAKDSDRVEDKNDMQRREKSIFKKFGNENFAVISTSRR